MAVQYQIDMNNAAPVKASTVLVVEDNLFNQRLVAKMLERLQVQYHLAGSIEEARSCLQQHHYNTILMDVHLPDGMGDALATEIKVHLSDTRIYLFTADGCVQEEAAQIEGIDGLLRKPFVFEDLKNLLEEPC